MMTINFVCKYLTRKIPYRNPAKRRWYYCAYICESIFPVAVVVFHKKQGHIYLSFRPLSVFPNKKKKKKIKKLEDVTLESQEYVNFQTILNL